MILFLFNIVFGLLKFRDYHYWRKNDIILTLFDGEIISFDESESDLMKGRKDN
jgi:hypothetical protein